MMRNSDLRGKDLLLCNCINPPPPKVEHHYTCPEYDLRVWVVSAEVAGMIDSMSLYETAEAAEQGRVEMEKLYGPEDQAHIKSTPWLVHRASR